METETETETREREREREREALRARDTFCKRFALPASTSMRLAGFEVLFFAFP